MPEDFQVRQATERDADTLAEFNRALALETEGKELAPATIASGVSRFLRDPRFGFYVVAETGPILAGALMITYEWTDWRDGLFWWLQSVYVRPAFRRQGVFKRLHRHIERMAADDPSVRGLRLYVEHENEAAQATYRSLGLERTSYLMFERLFPAPTDKPAAHAHALAR